MLPEYISNAIMVMQEVTMNVFAKSRQYHHIIKSLVIVLIPLTPGILGYRHPQNST